MLNHADSAVCHLAGALGKPIWLLNRFHTCARWNVLRTDSPWYASMRIFRQTEPGDWRSVIAEVARDLRQRAQAFSSPDKKKKHS
ncbi:MAG: hypothetical protein ACJ8AW_30500 [Rhodopila sp.]|jgi:hypothetical protein